MNQSNIWYLSNFNYAQTHVEFLWKIKNDPGHIDPVREQRINNLSDQDAFRRYPSVSLIAVRKRIERNNFFCSKLKTHAKPGSAKRNCIFFPRQIFDESFWLLCRRNIRIPATYQHRKACALYYLYMHTVFVHAACRKCRRIRKPRAAATYAFRYGSCLCPRVAESKFVFAPTKLTSPIPTTISIPPSTLCILHIPHFGLESHVLYQRDAISRKINLHGKIHSRTESRPDLWLNLETRLLCNNFFTAPRLLPKYV